MIFELVLHDKIKRFEEILLEKASQEKRAKGKGAWLDVAERYFIQKERLKLYPWSEEFNDQTPEEEFPPIMKYLYRNTTITNLYRWGIPGRSTGNHRILYAIHNYHRVILIHYFNKQYNGDIRREDIQPAEERYLEYCFHNPSLYPIKKESEFMSFTVNDDFHKKFADVVGKDRVQELKQRGYLAAQIISYRHKKKMTQQDLATDIDVAKSTIGRLEAGLTAPNYNTLLSLSRA